MARDIEPVLLAYLASGVVLAILQILAIVLSAAYCAVLSRRLHKNSEDAVLSSLLQSGRPRHERHLELYNLTAAGLDSVRDSGAPSTGTASRKSGLDQQDDDGDRVSTVSSRHGANYNRSSLYLEPSQEIGTVI
jgi:hypothetical protein